MSKDKNKEKRFKVSEMLQGPKRLENESYEDYKKRLKQNKQILKLYNTVGRDVFKQMFPEGIQYKVFEQPIEEEKVIQEEVGEAK